MSYASSPELALETEGPVLWAMLNRPEQLNALNATLIARLGELFSRLRHDLATRVVVLQGAGRAFCAGLDLKEFGAEGARRGVGDMLAGQKAVRDIMLAMRRCPQPIIGIVQGAASGGGMALALACDVRLATPDARMNAAFVKIGLTGCDVGVSYLLPRLVGSSVAAELLLTGRFIDAERARSLDLFSCVGPRGAMLREAREFANDMLATAPLALRLTKEGLSCALDAPSLESAVAMEDRQQVLCTRSPEFGEAVRAFVEKRTPGYVQKI